MLRFLRSALELIFTPFIKIPLIVNSEKISKFFIHRPIFIYLISLFVTAAFVFIIYLI